MLKDYIRACRVDNWYGWMLVFILGSVIFNLPSFERIVILFTSFSIATASIYVLNQYFDCITDRENKVKSNLPVASGRITPRKALKFSLLLAVICIILVFIVDIRLSPLTFLYLGLWTLYSSPPFQLKAVPIADFIVSGVGAGLLPFLMGLGVSYQLSTNIPSILLSAIPIMLFHSGSHIIQAVGDYEADYKTGIHTFVVKYGKKRAINVAGFIFLGTTLLPFIYIALGPFSLEYLFLFLIILSLFIPVGMHYLDLYKDPSTRNVVQLQKIARKYGIIVLAVIWTYILLVKNTGF
jgi:4-hydroxybenzoate polyprenyltransferase